MKVHVKFIDRIILVLFLISLVLVVVANEWAEPQIIRSDEILLYYGTYVKFCGNLKGVWYSERSDTTFMEVQDSYGVVKAVKFRSGRMNITGEVCVEGEVTSYKGELEIIVRKLYIPKFHVK